MTDARGPARCHSCGADIRWATMNSGKANPLDADPTPDGNVAAHLDDHGVLRARVLKADEEPDAHERRGVSHFTTCPSAALHRRRA